jgi:hypothetical protein
MGATDLKLRDNGAGNGGVGLKALSCRLIFTAGRFDDKAQAGVAAVVGSRVFSPRAARRHPRGYSGHKRAGAVCPDFPLCTAVTQSKESRPKNISRS